MLFCGHLISNGERKPNPKKVESIRMLKSPSCREEAQSLFGLLNYHRTFISDFASKTASISSTYKGKQFKWTHEAETSFKNIQEEICNHVLRLRIPDLAKEKLVLESDASDKQMGACLFVCRQNNRHKHSETCLEPIEYFSRMFNDREIKYFIREKEMLAFKSALNQWRQYLLGRNFIWRTDHKAFKWAGQTPKPKIAKWMCEISEFDFSIETRKSHQMCITDGLSRIPMEINQLRLSPLDLKQFQKDDPTLKDIYNYVSINRWPRRISGAILEYAKLRQNLLFGPNGELKIKLGNSIKLIIPNSLKNDVMETYHNLVGHPGEQLTRIEITNRYYWLNMENEIIQFVKTCEQCQRTKPNLKPRKPPMAISDTPKGPWMKLALDLTGPLSETISRNKYILVITDLFSKKITAVALPSKDSWRIAKAARTIFLQNPRRPEAVLTDNGTEFKGEFTELLVEFNISRSLSAPYHPQSNGQVERMNQTLKNKLNYLDPSWTHWDEVLDEATHLINGTKQSQTGASPFEIAHAIQPTNLYDYLSDRNQTTADITTLR